MNARFNMNTPKEAAKRLGVSEPVVTGWCRNGVINCNKVGDGTQKDRYEITDEELDYIHTTIQKFGVKDSMLRYRKDWKNGRKPAEPRLVEHENPEPVLEPQVTINFDPKPVIDPSHLYSTIDAGKFLGIDKSYITSLCRDERINCVQKKSSKGQLSYYILGEELQHIKGLYDKYGKGKGGAMSHYSKDWKGVNSAWNAIVDNTHKVDAKGTLKPNEFGMFTSKDVYEAINKQPTLSDDELILKIVKQIRNVKAEIAKKTLELENLKASLEEIL